MRWVNIFKTGEHTSRKGLEREYPIAELKQAAANYDPAKFKAPLVLDHYTANIPDAEVHKDRGLAFGYPKQLKVVGNTLKAGFEKVAPEFLEWVSKGNLLAISPSFYLPNDPRNPNPGELTLRHVSALGDKPPAVKGLGELEEILVELSEPESETVVEFEMPANPLEWLDVETLWAQVSELSARVQELETEENSEPEESNESPEENDMTYLKIALEALNALCAAKGIEPLKEEAEYSEADLQDVLAKATAPTPGPSPREIELEQQLATLKAESRRQAIASFMEPLVSEGKVLAAEKNGLAEVLNYLSQDDAPEFAEGETKTTLADILKTHLKSLDKRVEFAEISAASGEMDEAMPEFQEAPGFQISTEKKALLRKMAAYKKAHPEADAITAYKAVGGR